MIEDYEGIEDRLLLVLIRGGDEKAFRFLFERFFVSLCRFGCVYINDRAVVEDLVQDVFIAVWERRVDIEVRSWKSYLFQAVRNRVINYVRDNERFVQVSAWSVYERGELDGSFEVAELDRLICEAVCSLSGRCGEVFRMSRYESKSNREIAAELNVSVKFVEAQITKALKAIRRFLGDSYFRIFV